MEHIKSLVDRAFYLAAEEAIRSVIAGHAGSGIDSDIKSAIKEKAREIVFSDPEVIAQIRAALLHWIRKENLHE